MKRISTLLALIPLSGAWACVGDVDGVAGIPPAHNCSADITASGDWQNLTIYHSEPKTCPVPLDEQGQWLELYGVVVDADSAASETNLQVWMYPGGYLLASDSEFFHWDNNNSQWMTPIGVNFEASLDAGPWDRAEWEVVFLGTSREAEAELTIQYTTDSCPSGDCLKMF